MNLFSHVKNILISNTNFYKDNKLFKNTIIEATLKLDSELLTLLLNDDLCKQTFFTQVNTIMVFDKIKFQKFVSNKEFLPNSYTSFVNKIGLSANSDFLSQASEVVLDFPYKDCVLEGGQSKEEQKSSEIFWNQTLASDEIDRLFEPKVLNNWIEYSSDRKNTNPLSVSTNDNLIIKGNNLIALHSLKKVYQEKIKLIYIDPPYNTGNDSFQYNDSFNHATWLTFMKNRLEIAWQLLAKDGTFFIQVDDSEFAYLKVLCDEVFGRNSFRETIVLKSSTESGVNAINVKRGERLFKVKEYILFYSKDPKFRFKPFFTKTAYNINYKFEIVKNKNKYTITDLYEKIYKSHLKTDKSEYAEIIAKEKFVNYCLNNAENIYSLEKNIKKAGEKFKTFAALNKPKNEVEEYTNTKKNTVLVYDGGSLVPLKERVITVDGGKHFGILASDLWVDIGTTPSSEGGIKFSNGKKPEKLLARIIEMTTNENDLVLDYHLGSGTTAAVAMKMNRKFIGIEQLDYGENDSIVRLQNVMNGEQSGISKDYKWKGGSSFKSCKIATVSQNLISQIQESKTIAQINILKNEIINSIFIKYNINSDVLKTLDFSEFEISEAKINLLALIDFNQFYIPLSDIKDVNYKIDSHTIQLNSQFYSL